MNQCSKPEHSLKCLYFLGHLSSFLSALGAKWELWKFSDFSTDVHQGRGRWSIEGSETFEPREKADLPSFTVRETTTDKKGKPQVWMPPGRTEYYTEPVKPWKCRPPTTPSDVSRVVLPSAQRRQRNCRCSSLTKQFWSNLGISNSLKIKLA